MSNPTALANSLESAEPPKPLSAMLRSFFSKPAAASVVSAAIIFLYFSLTAPAFGSLGGIANWLDAAATIGVVALAVCLLMISGNFDLSSGVTIGTTSVVMSVLATEYNMPVPFAMLCSLIVALTIGLVNGLLVVKTGLHSFLVTLAMMFVLRGLNVAITLGLTGSVSVGGIAEASGYDLMHSIFGSRIAIGGVRFQVSILWWALAAIILTWVLTRTRFGNWVQAIGGNEAAARAEAVPVGRVKVSLFVLTSCAAWMAGMFGALRIGSAQAGTGFGLELQFVVAAVMGGCLLFGGRGSVPGTFLGAITFGMLSFGITYARWPGELYWLFLGLMLFFAVLLNSIVLRRVSGASQ